MAQKKQDTAAFDELRASIAAGKIGNLYVFYGEERYLLENYLEQIRKLLDVGGFSEFNYKRFEGQSLSVDELSAACDMLPAFAERTLIEVHDFDMFKTSDETKQKLISLLTNLPEYVCLIFVCDTVEWKPDGRLKITDVIKKAASIVEFNTPEASQLNKWIKRHFSANGKTIDTPTAEYLAFLTGGLMTTMNTEIEKLCSWTKDETITRAHIDSAVTPALDAVVWQLTDHIAAGSFDAAAAVMSDLLSMHEAPHKLIYTITLKLRQLLSARVCYENRLGEKDLMKMCDIRQEFQARNLLTSARKTTVRECRQAVLKSAETAYRMNSGSDPESCLTELLISLAANRRSLRV